MDEYSTIRIKIETRDRLKSMGMKGESYDDIIMKLISDKKIKK